MLDWIFEGIVTWISNVVSDMMDAVSGLFLQALGTDMTAMEEYFPFVIILFRCVLFIGYVPTFSMEPTLKTDSVLLGIRIIGSIETGDIIVFRHNERLFVKRVAAVGGDMIEYDGQLVTVPVDCFYVLGDNTEHSYDSRYWVCPFVTLKDIVAKVCAE